MTDVPPNKPDSEPRSDCRTLADPLADVPAINAPLNARLVWMLTAMCSMGHHRRNGCTSCAAFLDIKRTFNALLVVTKGTCIDILLEDWHHDTTLINTPAGACEPEKPQDQSAGKGAAGEGKGVGVGQTPSKLRVYPWPLPKIGQRGVLYEVLQQCRACAIRNVDRQCIVLNGGPQVPVCISCARLNDTCGWVDEDKVEDALNGEPSSGVFGTRCSALARNYPGFPAFDEKSDLLKPPVHYDLPTLSNIREMHLTPWTSVLEPITRKRVVTQVEKKKNTGTKEASASPKRPRKDDEGSSSPKRPRRSGK